MFTVTHQPGLATPDRVGRLAPLMDTAILQAGDVVRAALAAASPGSIAQSWTVQPVATVHAVATVSTHPGVRPLNDGASWPGAMPPPSALAAWAAARGLNPFAVAKSLKANGLVGRHFVEAALQQAHGAVPAMLQSAGVRAWMAQLTGA